MYQDGEFDLQSDWEDLISSASTNNRRVPRKRSVTGLEIQGVIKLIRVRIFYSPLLVP